MRLAQLRCALATPLDASSLVAFRALFGLLAALATVRVVALGWVDELLSEPAFHFAWIPGLEPASAPVLHGLFALQFVAGLAIAVGFAPRAALVLWLLSFGYVELLDKALYLNHYVLFSLLGVWLLIAPVHGGHGPGEATRVPAWTLYLLRAQVASVYLWAGLAKLNPDWLLAAQPLRTWLGARADVPLVGPLLAQPLTAYVMSWSGALYDLLIPVLLLVPRTRALGLVLVVGFHVAVGLLFPIGIFPLLMMASATLFLDPSWPRALGGRVPRWRSSRTADPPQHAPPEHDHRNAPAQHDAHAPRVAARPLGVPATLLWTLLVTLMLAFPARFLVYGERVSWTDVNWTERGYRFAWRVLLNEKTGLVDFRVVEHGTGRVWRVMPRAELSPLQDTQMRTQPDLIRDYALHLQRVHRREGRDVAVYADSWASLNGRPTQRMIRGEVDLTQPLAALEEQHWIVPLGADAR